MTQSNSFDPQLFYCRCGASTMYPLVRYGTDSGQRTTTYYCSAECFQKTWPALEKPEFAHLVEPKPREQPAADALA